MRLMGRYSPLFPGISSLPAVWYPFFVERKIVAMIVIVDEISQNKFFFFSETPPDLIDLPVFMRSAAMRTSSMERGGTR